MKLLTRHVDIHRNTNPDERFKRGSIKHHQTKQYLFWLGPLFVVVRNSASANVVTKARNS